MTTATNKTNSMSPREGIPAVDWSVAFDTRESNMMVVGNYPRALSVRPEHFFTGKLKATLQRDREIASGSISIYPSVPEGIDGMSLLCLIATHSNLARARYGRMLPPAVFVRQEKAYGRTFLSPGMPLVHLSRISRTPVPALKTLLEPMVRDGALRMAITHKGTPVIIFNHDFMVDQFNRYHRVKTIW